jgi:hypothetical protein
MAGFALVSVLRQGRRRDADSDSQSALAAAARQSESARGLAVLCCYGASAAAVHRQSLRRCTVQARSGAGATST